MKFSPSTLGWYPEEDLHIYPTLPADLVDVSDERYAALLNKGVTADANGQPVEITAPPVDPKVAIQAEIDALERESMTNRGARELQLELMRERGAGMGLQNDAAIAAKVPYFAKLLALDTQIRALRAQL